MNVMGIIFASDGNIGSLTHKRTMGSLPYGGRYRQIDFHLSNMVAAGIRRVGIISRHNYQSLMNHIGSGEEWGLELEEGGLEFLTPFAMSSTDIYRGKLDNLNFAMDFLEYGTDDEYVIMADSAIVYNIDLTRVMASHLASGKDVTVVTKEGIANGVKQLDLAVKLDDKGQIADMAVDYVAPSDYLASMDIFVLSRKFLLQKVRECIARNQFHMDRDLVMGGWQKGEVSVNIYKFQGPALFNETVEEYFHNSLALISKDLRHDIFGFNHPVYTKVRDRVPTYYGESCEVDSCIVADGCMLDGSVKNSVLFRQVNVCEGAQVENCLVMNDAVIGENAQLKNVILDKDVVVRPGAVLIGTESNPIIVKKGEIV